MASQTKTQPPTLDDLVNQRIAEQKIAAIQEENMRIAQEREAIAAFEAELQEKYPDLMALIAPYHTAIDVEADDYHKIASYFYRFTVDGISRWILKTFNGSFGVGSPYTGTVYDAVKLPDNLIDQIATYRQNRLAQAIAVTEEVVTRDPGSLDSDLSEVAITLYQALHDDVLPYLRRSSSVMLGHITDIVDKATAALAEHGLIPDDDDEDEYPF